MERWAVAHARDASPTHRPPRLRRRTKAAIGRSRSFQRARPRQIGIDNRERSHIDDAPHGGGWSEDVRSLCATEQNRAYRNAVAACDFEKVVSNIRGIDIRKNEQIRLAIQC